MLPYLAGYMLTLISAVALSTEKKAQLMVSRVVFFIAVLFVTGLAALRYQTGWDWLVYTELHQRLPSLAESGWESVQNAFSTFRFEHGYLVLGAILKSISNSVSIVFATMAVFTVGLYALAVRSYSPHPGVSLLLYYRNMFFQTNMALIRQGLGVSLFLYAIRFVRQRRPLPYFVLLGVAFLFHRSALILVPLYWVLHRRFSERTILLFLGLAIGLYFIDWIGLLSRTLFPALLPEFLWIPLQSYLSRPAADGITLSLVEKLVFVVLAVGFRRRAEDRFDYYNEFTNLIVLDFAVVAAFSRILVLQQRIGLYFRIADTVLLVFLFQLLRKEGKPIALLGLAAYALLWLSRVVLTSWGYLPYSSILFG